VPPPFARSIAAKVMTALCIVPTSPLETIKLGEERLLYFDTTEAANYFGSARPITRRDRKSGAKKRKQQEIENAGAILSESPGGQ
jgi:DNA (cytosine-5)-methyltransferase 1